MMTPTEWFLIFLLIFVVVLLHHVFTKRETYLLSWCLPGPTAFPLIGNALIFFRDNQDIFDAAVSTISQYPSPMRLWFGPKFVIIFSEPDQASKILSSPNFSFKDDIYKFMKVFNGEGLISGSGFKWKRDRKLMGHLFAVKNISLYFSTICHHTNTLLEKLEMQVDKPAFNVEKYIHRCSADFVNESIVGIKTNAQNDIELDGFLSSMDRMYDIVHARIVKVWLQIEWIFRLTPYWIEQENGKRVIHGFIRTALEKANEARLNNFKTDSFLEQMLEIRDKSPEFATDEELVHHLTTLYSASEDTVTTICSFALLVLGMYQTIQERVVNEIQHVLGGKDAFDLDELSQLKYLEMCIKDILRLFPIAPFIMRVSALDHKIDEWAIPKGCSVVVAIHNIHRNPQHWEKPNDFYPEHFLPEAAKNRHPCAYLPFSAGPRSCLGKAYSQMALKIVLVKILRKFVIIAEGNVRDIRLKTDISVRPRDRQYPIKLKLRR